MASGYPQPGMVPQANRFGGPAPPPAPRIPGQPTWGAAQWQAAGYPQPGMVPHASRFGGPTPPPAPRMPASMQTAASRGGPPRREMDSLLEELKAKQVQRTQMTKVEVAEGSPPAGPLPLWDMGAVWAAAQPGTLPNLTGMAPGLAPGLGTAVSSSSQMAAGSSWGAGGASAAADELASLLFLPGP
eukprot:s4416_g4.t1